jgi:hypothetical protein
MPNDIITRIETLAKANPVGMNFTNMRNKIYADSEYEDSDNSDSDNDSDYDSNDDSSMLDTTMIMMISLQEWTCTTT